jgi:hypothetical protein
MSLTRANFEEELVSRQQSRLEAVDMAVTHDGSNTDLNSPIGYAIRQCGGSVATFGTVANGDLSSFAEEDYDKLIDVAEYRLLLNIKGRWGKVDMKAGQLSESLSQFAKDLDEDIKQKFTLIQMLHGFGVGTISVGYVDYDFQETNDDAE